MRTLLAISILLNALLLFDRATPQAMGAPAMLEPTEEFNPYTLEIRKSCYTYDPMFGEIEVLPMTPKQMKEMVP